MLPASTPSSASASRRTRCRPSAACSSGSRSTRPRRSNAPPEKNLAKSAKEFFQGLDWTGPPVYFLSCAEHGARVGRSFTGRQYAEAEGQPGEVDESETGSANFFGPTRNTTALEAVVVVGGERPTVRPTPTKRRM